MTADPIAPARRRPVLRAAVAAAVGVGLLTALAPAAVAGPAAGPPGPGCDGAVHLAVADGTAWGASVAGPAADAPAAADDPVTADGPAAGRRDEWTAADAALAGMTGPGYSTSALAAVRTDGRLVWRNATGVADLASGAPADPRGAFRIGSATKTFVATTLLQLVGERRLDLDDRLECLLPGIVPHSGEITVRQLLDHTSGVADYTQDPAFDYRRPQWLDGGRFRHYALRDLVDISRRYPPAFRPGEDWQYSNTNYVLVGMVIEKLTGRSWGEEVTRRIIRPLGLRDTRMPEDSPVIPGPHAHGYYRSDTGPVDVTLLNPSMAGSSGAGTSTAADLTAFLRALLGGRLLRPAELAAMQQTTAHGEGRTYGLGLQRMDTPCGSFWGHGGGFPSYVTTMLGSADGKRQFAASATVYDTSDQTAVNAAWQRVATTALCGPQPATAPASAPASVSASAPAPAPGAAEPDLGRRTP
ncbi:serine hydrolase domain-containing protein [Kitasatospora sp. NPDC018619]|uniref:serine hydrolase domain-containing protein n=1 Tax=unclassified Kitasatospora TaxID=2633591 RepID=UPI00379C13FC